MAKITIHITDDPHNPDKVPRNERAANLDAAVVGAMRNRWTCEIHAFPETPDERRRDISVTCGVVTTPVPDEDRGWWAKRVIEWSGLSWKRYRVTSPTGVEISTFTAETPEGALEAMASDELLVQALRILEHGTFPLDPAALLARGFTATEVDP